MVHNVLFEADVVNLYDFSGLQFSTQRGILRAELRTLPFSAEFLCFWRILRNSVLAGVKGTNMAYFGQFQAAVDN